MSTPTAEALKAAAHRYARRRLRVIPLHFICDGECSCRDGAACKSAGKHPILRGWQDRASTSGADIEEWWTQRPQAGVGIATGEQSGLFVLDVDPDNGGLGALAALEAKHGKLPYTHTVRTGSGGKHYYFNWPGFAITNSASKLGDGLDIRGNGGQVVAPPSRSAKGDYVLDVDAPVADAPAWLLDLIRPPSPRTPTSGVPVSSEVANHYAAAALAGELARVRASQPGEQNNTLNRAAFSLGQLIAVGALDKAHVREELLAAADDCGYIDRDGLRATEGTIDSGLDGGERKPRTPWPPVGRAGATEEEIAAIKAIYGENSPEMSWLGEAATTAVPSAHTSAPPPSWWATDEELDAFLTSFTRYQDPARLGRRIARIRADAAKPRQLYRHAQALVTDAIAGHYPAARAVTALGDAYRNAGGTDPTVPRRVLAAALGAVLNAKVTA